MNETGILDLCKSNEEIIRLINSGNPFTVVRLGIGTETIISVKYIQSRELDVNNFNILKNAGIYCKNNSKQILELFCIAYNSAIRNSDVLASFESASIKNIQDFYSKHYKIKQIHSRSLEPFYQVLQDIKPWTHYLLGKKVLVINPFVESFQKQIKNKFQIFKDKQIFLDGQEFVFYKSFQTIAGNFYT